ERVPEERHDLLELALVDRAAWRRVHRGERAQQGRDRWLPLPVDARVDDALLVDLELGPRATRGHQVRREDLLGGILRLHQVGAGAAHELRHDHALGAVDDERAPLGHHREVPHEDGLLADLARLLVDEADRYRERSLVGQVLLTAFLDRELRLSELVRAELHRERAGVVLDRRDVIDRLAQALVQEPLKRGLLDVDQVGKVENVLETRETGARARRSDLGGQEMKPPLEMSSETRTAGRRAWTAGQRRNLPGYPRPLLQCKGSPAESAEAWGQCSEGRPDFPGALRVLVVRRGLADLEVPELQGRRARGGRVARGAELGVDADLPGKGDRGGLQVAAGLVGLVHRDREGRGRGRALQGDGVALLLVARVA